MNFLLILLINIYIYIYIKEQIEKVFNMTYNTNFAHAIHVERIFFGKMFQSYHSTRRKKIFTLSIFMDTVNVVM